MIRGLTKVITVENHLAPALRLYRESDRAGLLISKGENMLKIMDVIKLVENNGIHVRLADGREAIIEGTGRYGFMEGAYEKLKALTDLEDKIKEG